jgi:hypothetical protein
VIQFEKRAEGKDNIYNNLSRGITISYDQNGDLYVSRLCKLVGLVIIAAYSTITKFDCILLGTTLNGQTNYS